MFALVLEHGLSSHVWACCVRQSRCFPVVSVSLSGSVQAGAEHSDLGVVCRVLCAVCRRGANSSMHGEHSCVIVAGHVPRILTHGLVSTVWLSCCAAGVRLDTPGASLPAAVQEINRSPQVSACKAWTHSAHCQQRRKVVGFSRSSGARCQTRWRTSVPAHAQPVVDRCGAVRL